jgi:hypothetical protein
MDCTRAPCGNSSDVAISSSGTKPVRTRGCLQELCLQVQQQKVYRRVRQGVVVTCWLAHSVKPGWSHVRRTGQEIVTRKRGGGWQ